MKKIKLILLAIGLTCVSSCTQSDVQESDNTTQGQTLLFTSMQDTRTGLSSDFDGTTKNLAFTWSSDDKITVIPDVTGASAYLSEVVANLRDNNKQADFKVSGISETVATYSIYYCGLGSGSATTKATIKRLQTQSTANIDNISANGDCATATATATEIGNNTKQAEFSLTHYPLFLAFGITATDTELQSAKLVGIEVLSANSSISGIVDLATADKTLTDAKNSIYLNITDPTIMGTDVNWFYIVSAPIDDGEEMEVRYYFDINGKRKTITCDLDSTSESKRLIKTSDGKFCYNQDV